METWWPVLIIILVIALAVGPVMLMQPTPQQRRLASLRGRANGEGLIISMPAWPEKIASKPTVFMRYIAPWQTSKHSTQYCLLYRRDYEHELHVEKFWQVFPKDQEVPSELVEVLAAITLPSINVIGLSPQGVYIDWNENKTMEYDSVAKFLVDLRARLQS